MNVVEKYGIVAHYWTLHSNMLERESLENELIIRNM